MGRALYRQYRSKSFDEVIGQDHITTTLKNSLKSGSIAHAYLLTGPRGVGKTSVARILAFEVNGLPYDADATHMDIIEIDAASNRRIDEVRDLREKARIAPVSAKYKVYIIDEVHMLTREAFNALLKTLEEPPDHVIFILATTERHKLPDTIVSRCITLSFQPITTGDAVKHLKQIAKTEKIQISDEALELLAEHGEGSFRDSISLLDQARSLSAKVELKDIESTLGIAPEEKIKEIVSSINSGDAKKLNNLLDESYRVGASELNLAKQIAQYVRNQLVNGEYKNNLNQATDLLKDLLDVPGSPKPRASLELSLLKSLINNNEQLDSRAVAIAPERIETPAIIIEPTPNERSADEVVSQGVVEINDELWKNVLQKLKTQNNTLYSVARMAQAEVGSNKLLLSFKFPFHFKQVNNPKNKSLLAVIIEELGHKDLQLEVQLSENKNSKTTQKDDKALININNIFGDSEVLES